MKTLCVAPIIVSLVLLPVCPVAVHAADNGQQIMFFMRNGTFTYIRIEGTNQHNVLSIWERSNPSGIFLVTTDNWWWKGTVNITFDIVGEGRGRCVLDYIGGEEPDFAVVTHTVGQAGCTGDQGSVSSPLDWLVGGFISYVKSEDSYWGGKLVDELNLASDAYECAVALPTEIAKGNTATGILRSTWACKGLGQDVLEEIIRLATE